MQDSPGRAVAANIFFVQPLQVRHVLIKNTQIGEITAQFNAGRLHLLASALPTTWLRAIDHGQEDSGRWAKLNQRLSGVCSLQLAWLSWAALFV